MLVMVAPHLQPSYSKLYSAAAPDIALDDPLCG